MDVPEVRTRNSARVLVIDSAGRLLLLNFRTSGPAKLSDNIWLTPGGRIEDGEAVAVAAARELAEETGIAATPAELGQVVATRTGTWCVPDGTLAFHGTDHYFMLPIDATTIDTSQHTELERDIYLGYKWWTVDELRTTDELIDTPKLTELLDRVLSGDAPSEPVVLPWSASG